MPQWHVGYLTMRPSGRAELAKRAGSEAKPSGSEPWPLAMPVRPFPARYEKGPPHGRPFKTLFLSHFAEIGDVFEHGDETVEQAQAVLANRLILVHDHNAV